MKWCFLITCTSQFPRDQMCRYMASQEKRQVKQFYSGLSDMIALRESKEHPVLQSLPHYVPSCLHKEDFFSFCVCPIAARELLSVIACSSSEPDALQLAVSGGGCRLPVPPADRWVRVRRSGSPGVAHSLLPVLPLRVHSALLWHSAPRFFLCFQRIEGKGGESHFVGCSGTCLLPTEKNKGSVLRASERPGHLNKIPYQRWLWHMSAFTPFTLSCW